MRDNAIDMWIVASPIAEWGGAKLRVPIEDDAILTDAGIYFFIPPTTGFW